MAEAALFGIAKSVLSQLASPALDEFRLLWGHNDNLERLKSTVIIISNVLEDADRRPNSDLAVQGWLARLRMVLYEADDLFDIISAKILVEKNKKGSEIQKKVRHFVSKPYRFAYLVKTAHQVKKIRGRMDDIARDINGFNFLPVQTNLLVLDPASSITGREETHSYIPKNEVIGREQETEDVVRMLLPDTSQELKGVSVISIIGIGGLGKTTLAKHIYNDERVQKGFELCMWACINYFTPLKQVLRTLLKSATNSVPQDHDLDQLQSLFRKEIEGKRFLLVLDDVWGEDPQNWRELEHLLSSGKDGSKVLGTTRSELAAQSLRATKPYFHLQGMSDQDAWLLFKKIAFVEEGDQISSEWELFGQQIVRKCANVPLAIVTIASLLREKDKEMWFPLVNEELSRVFPDEYKKITHVLKFSYKELPYPVKRCFGYCSLFPKDCEFKKSKLVRLWIAQGFVEPLVNQSLEDRAGEYLFYLVKRCFFQLNAINEVTKYQMHDLMHDLAIEVAGSESMLVDQNAPVSWERNVRHVSINCESESMVDRVCSFSHSKSLRTFLPHCHFLLEENLSKLMSSFQSLRVLDLSDLGMKKVPTSIGELIHLRFLDLSRNSMKSLPSSVCSLFHLQSLILQGCGSLKELPKDSGNLLSLRHLVLGGCYSLVKMPAGLAALTSLVTIDRLVVSNPTGGLKYLENLDNLSGSLGIELPTTGWQNATTDVARSFLSRKSRLHALCFFRADLNYWRTSSELEAIDTSICALEPPPNLVELQITCFGSQEIPSWVTCLHNLGTLRLERCNGCIELPPLSHLPSLKELCISHMSSMVTIEDNKLYKPRLFFPSLEILSIESMPRLTSWWLQAPTVLPAFPRVTNVVIENCPKLTSCMPLFPLAEDFEFRGVDAEELIWHAIGREATSSTTSQLGNCSVLKSLVISGVRDLTSIAESQIRHLSALRELCIEDCYQLETLSCNGIAYLTSLEKLEIYDSKQLNNWVDSDDQMTEVRKIPLLPRLKHLVIPTVNRNLFKRLKYMASLETLFIYRSFNQDLQEEEEEGMPWKNLQKLRKMELVFGEIFNTRSNQRLLNGFQHLTSLQELTLCKCKELYLSWTALLGLNNLWILKIEDVEEVIDVDSDALVQTRPISASIRELNIAGRSGEWLNAIPWKSFPFLQQLRMEKLEGLPEGVQHLSALQRLVIIAVSECVVSLPRWMSSLSSLSYLFISGSSSELKKRCERLTGEDWPNIQHIQHIRIN